MPVSFTAIDFETANGSPASACAVGLVKVTDGQIVDRRSWLIRPPAGHDEFMPFNVQLHGVSRERVSRADTWEAQLPRLLEYIGEDSIVAHNAPFDVGVLAAASLATGCSLPDLGYVCTLRVARRIYDLPSYRLPLAARAAGYLDLTHHDPVSDAEACAAIAVDAATRLGASDLAGLALATGVGLGRFVLAERAEAKRLIASATFG
ncbi:exonuclease domain-containing protein [Pseudoclavibacter endophyticus]|uniref:DNA polymerase III subunit epsilon n=1 Tax=Pseudoclavibacter endophyticus TaxID=1778590 RepID=A0A6H9WFG3_9MICO|nr:exonuclease domain-containing protein [Pseudoclavibacter endophyticus]KAB1649699.1 DNA polymerase III subunit epsilon [Pseudoclavibacter endophyticus]